MSDKEAAQVALGQSALSSRTADAGSYLPADMKEECAELLDVLSRWFVLLDGEQHTAARRGVQRMFSPGRIRKLQESTQMGEGIGSQGTSKKRHNVGEG
ncbi:hypothetical protein [Streptomyces decoyicus]|uniref:hypothetical protein n=1 Tax=Streptomyces decoyicus TaxID=249567 RepID=UPI0033B3E802